LRGRGAKGKELAYVASQDQVVYHAHDPPHRIGQRAIAVPRPVKSDGISIADEAAGKKLIIDVQRCCPQVVKIYHVCADCSVMSDLILPS
jgi:hypothetical protein